MSEMNEYCRVMTQFQDNVGKGYFSPEKAEELFCNPMKKMYESLTKILKDNNIINVVAVEEEQ
jgi:hypothetical protein